MSGIRIAAIPVLGIAFRFTRLPVDNRMGIVDFWQMAEDEWAIALRGLTCINSSIAAVIVNEEESESIAQVPILRMAFSIARFSEDDDRIALLRYWQMSTEDCTSALLAAASSAHVMGAHLRPEQSFGPVCRSTSTSTIIARARKPRR